jgi:hypothetical protein
MPKDRMTATLGEGRLLLPGFDNPRAGRERRVNTC